MVLERWGDLARSPESEREEEFGCDIRNIVVGCSES